MELSLLGAFLGGVLTLLSPCSVMLLPSFFAYAFSNPRQIIARTGVFFLGLAVALVPLGILAGTLGAWVNVNRFTIMTVAAIIVILLGLLMAAGVPIPGLNLERSSNASTNTAVFALGTVYGLAGVCAGPLLGAALAFAAFGGDPVWGGIVLLIFAAGMVLPLLLLSLVWRRLKFVQNLVKP